MPRLAARPVQPAAQLEPVVGAELHQLGPDERPEIYTCVLRERDLAKLRPDFRYPNVGRLRRTEDGDRDAACRRAKRRTACDRRRVALAWAGFYLPAGR